jgi:molybdopterin-guanine dinucleotide biosynthesis protein A
MRFTKVDSNDVFDVVRLLSAEGKWEVGCRRMLFGIRVGLSQLGGYTYSLDYCAGDNPVFTLELLAIVLKILERYPEDATQRQIEDEFPGCLIKPIDRDPYCWTRLQEMAQEVRSEVAP